MRCAAQPLKQEYTHTQSYLIIEVAIYENNVSAANALIWGKLPEIHAIT
jgi:hypothetical protein